MILARGGGRGARVTIGALAAALLAAPTSVARAQQSAVDSAYRLFQEGERAAQAGTAQEVQRGIATLANAAAIFARAGEPSGEAAMWVHIGSAYLRLGRADSTITYARRALAQYARLTDPRGEAEALDRIAQAHQAMGQRDSALRTFLAEVSKRRQAADTAGEARALYDVADSYFQGGRADSAIPYYRSAAALYRAVGDRPSEATAVISLGFVFRDLGARDSARARIAAAVAMRRMIADTADPVGAAPYFHAGVRQYMGGTADGLNSAVWYWEAAALVYDVAGDGKDAAITEGLVGKAFLALGKADSAAAWYRRALARQARLGDVPGQAATAFQMSLLYRDAEQPDSALAYLRIELALRRQMHDSIGMGAALTRLGEQFWRQSAIDSALRAFRAALAIDRASRFRAGEATTLNDIGAVQQDIGRLDSALYYYRLALPLLRDTKQVAMEGSTLTNIGGVFREQGQNDSALVYFQMGRTRQHEGGDRANEAVSLGNIGLIFAMRGMDDSALAYYREALALHGRNEGVILSKIAQVYVDEGPLDSAFAYYANALALERRNGDLLNEMITLTDLAMLHQGALRGRKTAAQPPDLRTAVAYFDSASAVASTIAARAGSDANRVVFSEKAALLYEHWALSWHGLMSEMDPGAAARAGLAAVERGRAQALLQLMRGAPQGTATGKDLVAEGAELSEWAARAGVGVLSYYVTTDTLLLWVIAPGGGSGVVFSRDISRDVLAGLVGQLRGALGVQGGAQRDRFAGRSVELEPKGPAPPAGSAQAAAQALADAILPPDLETRMRSVTEIVIIPHGPLTMAPFAALPLASGNLLGDGFALRFAPSLASLREAERRPALADGAARTAALSRSLVVGNPTMPTVTITGASGGRVVLKNLPGAAAEGSWVAKRLGTTSLTGPEASEKEVRLRMPRATVVHLATHGYAYSTESMSRESFVALGPGGGDDGLLTVGEILDDPRLQLGADLVVLSGCQTGLGDLTQGEGTVGLQRAFLAKGARSVLVSLWNVSDDATALLMKQFYAHWLDDADNPSKAEALQRAEADVRKRPEYRDPKYWAAFQLVGAR